VELQFITVSKRWEGWVVVGRAVWRHSGWGDAWVGDGGGGGGAGVEEEAEEDAMAGGGGG